MFEGHEPFYEKLYCGAQTRSGSHYCASHAGRAFRPVIKTQAPKTERLDFLREIYRKAAVRYALMAEEAEMAGPGSGQDGVSLWDRADRLLALTR